MIHGSTLYKILVRSTFALLFGIALFSQCANPLAPTGGPRDTLPPRIVSMTPTYGTKNFNAKRVYIEFDEYIKLKDQQKEFFVSPFMEKKPLLTLRGRGIQIDIKDTLLENQTYSLNFGGSIQDNNEGNPLNSFRYVFSTGSVIDSMVMSGYTVDGYTRDSIGKTFIMFYDPKSDTIPEYDSTVFKNKPLAIGRAEANGIFIAENLKSMKYRIYAMEDKNNNQKYEPGVDKIGFLDSLYNPADMSGFNVWFDTARKYMVADPQIYFRLFQDEQAKRQYLASATRPLQHKAVIHFGAKHPEIKSLVLQGIDSSQIITEYMTPNRDSIALWFKVPAANLPDTIKGEITFLKHDSLSVLTETTQKLNLAWKFFETKSKKELKEVEKDSTKKVNPFKFTVNATAELNPEKHIPISFDYPLAEIDSANISVIRLGEGDKRYRVRFTMEHDSLDLRLWRIKAPWTKDQKYSLLIPSGAIKNIAEQSNDTLKADFTISSPEKYATIIFNLKGRDNKTNYVLQLLNESNRLLEEKRFTKTGKHQFNYVPAGTVKLRVTEDINGNGKWDKGSLVERRHSERVEIFTTATGDEEIATKVNWELEFDVDMNALFVPDTMENVMEKIRKANLVRDRKRAKEMDKKSPKYQENPTTEDIKSSGRGSTLKPPSM